MKYNDYELIYMVRENDDSSYDILFNKYIPIVKRIAYEYYKNFSSYGFDYDDFVQEGYLAFQRGLGVYNPDKDCLFYTFICLCVNRGILSFCKRISCESKNISNTNFVEVDKVALIGDSFIDDCFISNEDIRNIWDIVYQYDFSGICIFELRYNGFSFKEISDLLDISSRKAQFIYRKLNNYIRKKLKFVV